MKPASGLLAVALLATFAGIGHAQIMINLAVSEHATATTIFGYNSGTLSSLGTSYEQYGGSKATMNDGVTTQDNANTTFGNEGGQTGTSYGFGGYTNLTVPVKMSISSVNLYMNAFGDGGWFGHNSNFSFSSPLSAADLTAPLIQVTTDNGATWTTVATTNNYLSVFAGNVYAGQGSTPEVTFNLLAPATGIDGIRVIGLNGGYAGTGADANSTSGFMAINELQIEATPEPSTYALMLGGLAFLGFCLRRKTTLVK
jgi:hypothetical protein